MSGAREEGAVGKRDELTIWQQNVNKSLIAQHAVLNAMTDETDILCLQ